MNYLDTFNKTQEKLQAYFYVTSLDSWDYETEAPELNNLLRIKKISIIYEEIENIKNNPEYQTSLKYLFEHLDELNEIDKRRVTVAYKDNIITLKVPTKELLEYQQLLNEAHPVWVKAKTNNNFSLFQPYLEKIVLFNKKLAKYLETESVKGYDVLLDLYEEGMNKVKYDAFFKTLQEELVPFILETTQQKRKINKNLTKNVFSPSKQKEFSKYLIEQLGLNKSIAVLKEAAHPFTAGTSKYDIRLTTHYLENKLDSAIFSTIHEAGHGLYESHIADDLQFTNLGGGVSMGIHESQSRLFENMLGRDENFWKAHFPKLKSIFNKELKNVSLEDWLNYINYPKRSFIRTEADELTYPLHIMLRYEIERELIDGHLKVKDLPKTWNKLFKKYFNLKVPNDTVGVLQDVHWAGGSFGYFPTYALGSAISAQVYNSMNKDINIKEALSNNIQEINNWLTEHLHKYGALKTPTEVLKIATGQDFKPAYYIAYLKEKYSKDI
ncbi:MAG: carboxypeptidase M32 [Bacillales bacterium]|jgi:carboxypeptidase Taq|nr:carboxypeptidase M32 [Bacillales bacterium]